MENQSLQGLSFVREPKWFSLILINSPRRRPRQMTWEMPVNINCVSNLMFSITLNDRLRKFRVPALSGGRVVTATDCQTLMLWKEKQGFCVCVCVYEMLFLPHVSLIAAEVHRRSSFARFKLLLCLAESTARVRKKRNQVVNNWSNRADVHSRARCQSFGRATDVSRRPNSWRQTRLVTVKCDFFFFYWSRSCGTSKADEWKMFLLSLKKVGCQSEKKMQGDKKKKKRILAFHAWMKEFQLNRLFSGKSDGKWVI